MHDATPDDERRTPSDGPQEPADARAFAYGPDRAHEVDGRESAYEREPDEPAYERDPADDFEPAPEREPEEHGVASTAGPRPLGLVTQPTGHAEVDDRLRRLADVDHLAVFGHLDVYEDVHRGLRSTLTALDQHDPGS